MTKFYAIHLNEKFKFGGTMWVKKSSRTARVLEPNGETGRVFYFSLKEVVQWDFKWFDEWAVDSGKKSEVAS